MAAHLTGKGVVLAAAARRPGGLVRPQVEEHDVRAELIFRILVGDSAAAVVMAVLDAPVRRIIHDPNPTAWSCLDRGRAEVGRARGPVRRLRAAAAAPVIPATPNPSARIAASAIPRMLPPWGWSTGTLPD